MRHASRWAVFALVAIAQFMVVLDTAIISVALPVIKHQLHFSNSGIQWVVTAYVLTFGGFLLLGGRAADLGGAVGLAVLSGVAASVTASQSAQHTAAQALTTGYDIDMAVALGAARCGGGRAATMPGAFSRVCRKRH